MSPARSALVLLIPLSSWIPWRSRITLPRGSVTKQARDAAGQGRRERGVLCTRATEDAGMRRSSSSGPTERDQAVQGRRERGVLCTRATEDAGMRRSRSVGADAVEEDAVGAPVQRGFANLGQAQRREAGRAEPVAAEEEAPEVLV